MKLKTSNFGDQDSQIVLVIVHILICYNKENKHSLETTTQIK